MSNYTVIAVHPDNGQIVCHHVEAESAMEAFTVAAGKCDPMEFVVALPGHQAEGDTLTFPGDGVVDSETVLAQPDVFC